FQFLFFFLMFRHPPCSTLFPYTTLFRSLRRIGIDIVEMRIVRRQRRLPLHGDAVLRLRQSRKKREGQKRGRGDQPNENAVHDRLDRKSTRLNSSHVAISYAVFCLKKKTN